MDKIYIVSSILKYVMLYKQGLGILTPTLSMGKPKLKDAVKSIFISHQAV
jgi:hypothetical protein